MNRPALVRAAVVASIALVAAASPASAAFDIVINTPATAEGNALAANPAALAAFNRAAAKWEGFFTDDVQINIDAGLANLAAGVLGQNSSVTLGAPYVSTIRPALVADAANEASNAIVAALPATLTAGVNVTLPAGRTLGANVSLSKANAKALGFTGLDGSFGVTDATINFSSNFSFDFDNSNGVTAGTIDFESVAIHEIGHALGFSSNVDLIDVLTPAQYPTVSLQVLDLFRFGSNPGVAGFATAAREMRPGVAAVTSDGTSAWAMSTGDLTGDGNQASHWKADEISGITIGIMDPTLGFAQLGAITANDIRALDLIGWDVVVPEPTSLAALGGLVVLGRRRRRN